MGNLLGWVRLYDPPRASDSPDLSRHRSPDAVLSEPRTGETASPGHVRIKETIMFRRFAAVLPNTAGTPALRGFIPKANAPTVQKLVDAGAVILGKTNMHELAFGISGYNEGFFTGQPIGTRNPYDRTRFAGGSSSGTGAAIGARLAPGGLGSDTGGSVRIPAAVSGGAGLRPTIGRYSQDGVTPISHSRDTVGPMGQTVADVALLDAVMTGGRVPSPAPLSGVRLGVYRAYFYKDLDADTRSVIEGALDK